MIEQIKKAFPQIKVTDLNGGCNVRCKYEVLTFWFKKQKWSSSKTQVWSHFSDFQNVVDIINKHSGVKKDKVKKAIPVVKVVEQKSGTQACIDHIKAKAERIGLGKGETNAVAMMLKTVAHELEQYL